MCLSWKVWNGTQVANEAIGSATSHTCAIHVAVFVAPCLCHCSRLPNVGGRELGQARYMKHASVYLLFFPPQYTSDCGWRASSTLPHIAVPFLRAWSTPGQTLSLG